MTTPVPSEKLAKSFTCSCGKEHAFVPYVFAHWDVMLVHTCDCGALHHIRQGIATRAQEVPAHFDVGTAP